MTGQPARDPHEIPGLIAALQRDGYPHCVEGVGRDVGGLLVGRLRSAGPPQVIGSVRALDDTREGVDQGFPYSSWDTLHSEVDRLFPGKQIVGWYGGRAGGGLGMTENDRFIHSSFFNDPRQIAVIIDPHASRAVVFRWRGPDLIEHQHLRFTTEAGEPVQRRVHSLSEPGRGRRNRSPGLRSRVETAFYLLAIVISIAVIVWELFLR